MTSPTTRRPKFTEKDYWIFRLVLSWPLLLFGGIWLLGSPAWIFGVIVGVFYMVMATLYLKWWFWFSDNPERFEICKLLGFPDEDERILERIKRTEVISEGMYEEERIAKSPKSPRSPMETLVLQGWIIVTVVVIGVVYLVGTRVMTEYNKGIESQYDVDQREIDRVQSLLDQYQNKPRSR